MLTPQVIIDTEVKFCNVERVWQLGYEGQAQDIPIIDTGVNVSELPKGAVRFQVDLTGDNDGRDHHGHGTLMARFIRGIAPRAKIISVKALGRDAATTRDELVEALDYCATLSPRPKFINISVAIRRSFLWHKSCTIDTPCALCARVNNLWDEGTAVVAAAGNFSSLLDSLTCPAAGLIATTYRNSSGRLNATFIA